MKEGFRHACGCSESGRMSLISLVSVHAGHSLCHTIRRTNNRKPTGFAVGAWDFSLEQSRQPCVGHSMEQLGSMLVGSVLNSYKPYKTIKL